ncbi:hypothetical protein [Euzebya sp.]|uniref:hypothetical protein n=1 Tax=Euzebya sp. TaxID=1971409 RepID=UPI003514FCB2
MREPDSTATTWASQTRLLIDLAITDLEAGTGVRPSLVAFSGDDPLVLATLRPFDHGAHLDAVIEVGALVAGLGADRVAMSLSGRAWSLDDPIPPVLGPGADLRQRVIVVHRAEASSDDDADASVLTTIVPYDIDADDVVTTGPAFSDEGGEGPLTRALAVVVDHGRAVAAGARERGLDAEDVGRQVLRCESLGHRLSWAAGQMAFVEHARLLPLGDCWPGGGAATG